MLVQDSPGGIRAKWLIVNSFMAALMAACWHQGWLQYIFEKDITFISHGIAVVGLLVLFLTLAKTLTIAKLTKNAAFARDSYMEKAEKQGAELRESLQAELSAYTALIQFMGTSCFTVGVLGTAIGIVMGFANLDVAALSDITNIAPAVGQLLVGLSVAFHTTLVGGVVGLWLLTNYFLLSQGTTILYAKVMEG